jgi:hypothetical protein
MADPSPRAAAKGLVEQMAAWAAELAASGIAVQTGAMTARVGDATVTITVQPNVDQSEPETSDAVPGDWTAVVTIDRPDKPQQSFNVPVEWVAKSIPPAP